MLNEKHKIFISAYACEPGLGSEIGVGWHWVLEMSKYFELWVLTRESNRHTIEPWIEEHPEYAGIKFLYYDWPKWARFWKKGLRGVRVYYNLWQMCANPIVRRTMKKNDIRIFHHLTYGNSIWPVSGYGQRQFFIWGPVGGLEYIPSEFTDYYGRKSRVIEWLRRWTVRTLPLNFGFRRRCKYADIILCKTDITRQAVPEKYRDKAVLFTDVAVELPEADPKAATDSSREVKANEQGTKFLMVGRLDAWRGFDLAVEAMSIAVKKNPEISLTILGKGADKERIKALIKEKGLESHIRMLGSVPMEEYKRLLSESDCVLNPALKEAAVTVSFDCLAQGKPLICVDSTGYTRYFSNDYAVVIPREGRSEVINELSEAILRMTDSKERERLSANARQAAAQFSWLRRGEEIRDLINSKLG